MHAFDSGAFAAATTAGIDPESTPQVLQLMKYAELSVLECYDIKLV